MGWNRHDNFAGTGFQCCHAVSQYPYPFCLSCCLLSVDCYLKRTGVRMSLVLLPIVLKPPCSGTACLARTFVAATNVGTLNAPRRTCWAWPSKRPQLGSCYRRAAWAGQMHVNVPRRILQTVRIVGGLPTALML